LASDAPWFQEEDTVSRKSSVDQDKSLDNGQSLFGDAKEPVRAPDTSFDPTELERDTPAPSPARPDPFDPASLRLAAGVAGDGVAKKALLNVPVRRPDKSWFVRVHPDEAYRQSPAGLVELKEDRELYLVTDTKVAEALASESNFSPQVLFTAITRQGVLFMWPVKLPSGSGRGDTWAASAMEAAADMATKVWCRVVANMSLGAYDVYQAVGKLPEPIWPDLTLRQILRLAFKDKYIADMDHPVIRKLRGEV
jgi:hypothetical protein